MEVEKRSVIDETESLCPVCLQVIPAHIVDGGGKLFMVKRCAEHGTFEAPVWNGSAESYREWLACAGEQGESEPSGPHCDGSAGCPFCCGLCPEHESETFTAALMVTSRCNLNCPVCFTQAGAPGPRRCDPDLPELRERLRFYLETSGAPFPLELCGGEPTVRDDLCSIASEARAMGFDHIQLNTNGIRIAAEPGYAERLRDAGVTTVYLGFDGSDRAYRATCGRPLMEVKRRAVGRLAEAGIGIVLVPVVASGLNDDRIGDIVRFAKEHMPAVRGINFQPFGRLGRYGEAIAETGRVTIPDMLAMIEEQTDGELTAADFMPGGVEHGLCSFQALYMRNARGELKALSKRKMRTCKGNAAAHVRETVPIQWHASAMPVLTVGGMVFQDALTVDLRRLRRCPTHIIGKDRLYPLCAKYLTSLDGKRLYEGID